MAGKDTETPLVISQGHVSRVVIGCIICMLFVFIAGYYLGKKNQSEELSEHINQDAFADRIHSSLYTLYGKEQTVEKQVNQEEILEGQKR